MKSFILILFIYIFKLIDTYTFIDTQNSYVQYNQWNASRNGTLHFKFKTYKTFGLLLYSDNSKSSLFTEPNRNVLIVKLVHAKLSVTVQMGNKDYRSRRSKSIGENLNDLEWHYVTIKRSGRNTLVVLDKTEELIINDGIYDKLELNSGLFIGWISRELLNSDSLVDKTIFAEQWFTGCIDHLEYSHSHTPTKFMSKELVKMNVVTGCLNACDNQTCPNNGRCINQFTKIKCDCIGSGFEGKMCKKEAPSIQFKGSAFVTIDFAKRQKTTPKNVIKFRFKTTNGNGVIFAMMNKNDHLMVELYSNIIRYSVNVGAGHHISEINNIRFNNDKWHLVEIFRNGRHTSIRVDKMYCVNSSTPGVFELLDMRESLLHVGGHPNAKELQKMNSQSKRNFTGCLQQVYYDGLNIVNKILRTRSTMYKRFGNISKGCKISRIKVIKQRENQGASISVSKIHPDKYPGENRSVKATASTGDSQVTEKQTRLALDDPNRLSRSSVLWITVGLVIGSIVLLITVGVIVHNVRHRYRAVLLSSSLKNLKDNNNSLQRKFSSNDRILRGSTDRMIHGSSDRLIRASTDRLIRGSTDRLIRGSTDRIMRGSTDRIMRGSTDRIMRGSTDRLIRGNSERLMRASTDRIMRASTDRIPRVGDRSQRGSVHGSIPAINERYLRDNNKKDRHIKLNGDISMNNYSGRILNDIKDSPVLCRPEGGVTTEAVTSVA